MRGFSVADFANENYIWVLTQNGTQGDCKCESAFFIYRNLVGSEKFVFYGILDGGDVDFSLDDFAEACVKRCRLSAAGGACDEEQTLRRAENTTEGLERFFAEVETCKRLCGIACTEQSQYAFFAVAYRYGAQAYVNFLLKIIECKTSVVGEAALRDIGIRHDFEAYQYGLGKPLRKRAVFRQKSIDT